MKDAEGTSNSVQPATNREHHNHLSAFGPKAGAQIASSNAETDKHQEPHLHRLVAGAGVERQQGEGEPGRTLFHRDAAAAASPTPIENLTLDTLEPNPPTNKRPTISPASRWPEGHRRQGRPPALPVATSRLLALPFNCSTRERVRGSESRRLDSNQCY